MSDQQDNCETVHECDWCLDKLPCMRAGSSDLWICGSCEADVFMIGMGPT